MVSAINFAHAAVSVFLAIMVYFGSSSPWSVQTSELDTNLRGISVNANHTGKTTYSFIWASGSNGVILHSTDDGKTWKQLFVPDGAELDFRDIQGFGENVAYVMSSGDGDKSRIYKTTDGGNTWKLQYSDNRPGFFLDSQACDSITHCVALSDPVEGKFLLLETNDGEHWKELPRDQMPKALPKEGAFAASGTALTLCEGNIFFGTGGPAARIFRSTDRGRTWPVVETQIMSGNPSRGIFSIACKGGHLVAVGGDYKDPNLAQRVAAYSDDNGITWQVSKTQPGGYRSAVGLASDDGLVTVGPNGADVSQDKGVHWRHLDSTSLNAVDFDGAEGWAVGPKGSIVRFNSAVLTRH